MCMGNNNKQYINYNNTFNKKLINYLYNIYTHVHMYLFNDICKKKCTFFYFSGDGKKKRARNN